MAREEVLRKRSRDGNKVCTTYIVPKSSYALDFETCDGSVNCTIKDSGGRTLVTLTMTSSITVLDKGAYNICIEGTGTGTLYSEFTEGGSGDMNCCEEMRQADAEIRIEINNVSSQLRTLETKVNNIINGTTSTACCNELDGEIEALKQRVRVLEDATSSGDPACCEELRAEITPIKNRLTTIENDIASLKTRMSNAENNISDVTDRVNGAETEIINLESRTSTNENNITDLRSRMSAAESATGNITGLVNRITNAENEIDDLKPRMTSAENDIDELQSRSTSSETNITNIINRIGTAEGDIDSLETRVGSAENNINNLDTRVGNTEDDVDSVESRLTTVEGNINNLNVVGGTGISVSKSGHVFTVTNTSPGTGGGGGGTTDCCDELRAKDAELTGNINALANRIDNQNITAGDGISVTKTNDSYTVANALNIQQGTNVQVSKSGNNITISATDTNTNTVTTLAAGSGISIADSGTEGNHVYTVSNALNIQQGTNVQVEKSGNNVTVSATDTKPDVNKSYVDSAINKLNNRITNLDDFDIPNPLYVSPSGNDSTGDGTQSKPFRQIQKAIQVMPFSSIRNIYVAAGTYKKFYISNSKFVNIFLQGDVIISDNDSPIKIYDCSYLRITSNSQNSIGERTLSFSPTTNITYGIYAIVTSFVILEKYIKINFTGTYDSLFNSNMGANIIIGCHIIINSNLNVSHVFVCEYGSNISWNLPDSTVSSNIGSPNNTITTFCNSTSGSTISIIAKTVTLNNKYEVGLRGNGGIVFAELQGNNATTQIQQWNGGRVFTSNNLTTNSFNNINPLNTGEESNNTEFMENLENNPSPDPPLIEH